MKHWEQVNNISPRPPHTQTTTATKKCDKLEKIIEVRKKVL